MGAIQTSKGSLRVALISTCSVTTPPTAYGGTELVIAELARCLRELGHSPTVFATRDSTCTGARACGFDHPVWPPDRLAELRHASRAWLEIARGDFDVVHVNSPEAVTFSSSVPVPTVATVHHERLSSELAHYLSVVPNVAFAAISQRQADLSWELPFRAVIHHGLDVDAYPRGAGRGGYCAFLGRLAPCKGPHLAIDAARDAQVPIRLGGGAHDPEYVRREVMPRLDDDARWLGELDQKHKVELLSGASALLFPVVWEEPFGLVMIESMLVGTPVVAFRCGAASEVVEDGITGFLVDDVEEMTLRLRDIDTLSRDRCRERARARWSSRRMTEQYVELYRSVLPRWSPPPSALSTFQLPTLPRIQ